MFDCTLYTFLGIDLHLYVEGHGQYQQVGNDVKTSDAHQDLGVIERYLLGDLHHAENDHQIGAGERCQSSTEDWGLRHRLWHQQDSKVPRTSGD